MGVWGVLRGVVAGPKGQPFSQPSSAALGERVAPSLMLRSSTRSAAQRANGRSNNSWPAGPMHGNRTASQPISPARYLGRWPRLGKRLALRADNGLPTHSEDTTCTGACLSVAPERTIIRDTPAPCGRRTLGRTGVSDLKRLQALRQDGCRGTYNAVGPTVDVRADRLLDCGGRRAGSRR